MIENQHPKILFNILFISHKKRKQSKIGVSFQNWRID